ncbi:MAG: hypothetical protein SF028_06185 [Candidatus Sumerlaeia bacterium]|nr:hypothetical protein [Candidatus Sumerlaeia bacterium]
MNEIIKPLIAQGNLSRGRRAAQAGAGSCLPGTAGAASLDP